jgi:hypothetical protein
MTFPLLAQSRPEKHLEKQEKREKKQSARKEKDEKKDAKKDAKKSTRLYSENPYGTIKKPEKVIRAELQTPPDNITVKNTPFIPFSRTKVTVVKQRNVRILQTLPDGYSSTFFGGRNFYHHGGRYYGYAGNMYTTITAPIGMHLRRIPIGTRRVFIGGMPHFYYLGVYYKDVGNNEYEVVEPIVGTIVPELPNENVEEVILNGQTLYEYDNILYKSIVTKNGVQFEVVGKLSD